MPLQVHRKLSQRVGVIESCHDYPPIRREHEYGGEGQNVVVIRLGVISDGPSHESCSTQSWILTVLDTRSQSTLN
jgi:hypothetical protein